jgi:hypothetical protein
LLEKSLNNSKGENSDLERTVNELEARLAELENIEVVEKAAA